MKNRWMKKVMAIGLTLVMTAGALTGCGEEATTADGYAKELNIMIWEGSYPDSIFEEFEEKYGIHVNISYITNTDEILAKLIASNGKSDYDFIDLESAYVKPFVDNGLLEEIDFSNIPNSEALYDEVWGVVGDEDGKYTCPTGSHYYTFIVYNKETCPIEIKSFKDLADPALKDQICSVNSTISLFGTALVALGYEPDSTTESEYAEAADLWAQIKENVKVFTGASCYQTLENGECSVAFCFDYAQLLLQSKENWDKYAVADIDTGYESYSSTWAIPTGAEHKKEAELLMDFMLSDEQYAARVEYYPQTMSTDGVKELVSEDIANNPALNIGSPYTDDTWMVPVSDEQIELMDKYLTKFMSN